MGPETNGVGTAPTVDFSTALACMKNGQKFGRYGWNGKGMWVEVQRPDDNSKMTLPYLFMSVVGGAKVPWLASQSDLMAEDWYLVE